MESDTFYGEFMVKLIWRLSRILSYHFFFMKTPYNLQTNFAIKPPQKVSLSILSPYSLRTNHSGN